MGGECSTYGGEEIECRVLVRKTEGNGLLFCTGRRIGDNIKTNLKQVRMTWD